MTPTPPSDAVERVARAIYEADPIIYDGDIIVLWEQASSKVRDRCEIFARAAIASMPDTSRDVGEDGYVEAFYRIAIELGFNVARSSSPKDVFEKEMLPRLRALTQTKKD